MTYSEEVLPDYNEICIPVIVKGIENETEDWEENSKVISVTKNNLGFTLSRQCHIGNLLWLDTLDNSKRLGQSDENEKILWGIVQRCTSLGEIGSVQIYHIGIALIGYEPPKSFVSNPSQYYRICGISNNGFWKVEETEKEFITRKHPRYLAAIEVFIGLLNDSYNLEGGEKVLTENISFGGAAVFSSLEVNLGDCVKFISVQHEFTALSVVRNITRYASGKKKLHLEFVAGKFPLERLKL